MIVSISHRDSLSGEPRCVWKGTGGAVENASSTHSGRKGACGALMRTEAEITLEFPKIFPPLQVPGLVVFNLVLSFCLPNMFLQLLTHINCTN